MRYGASDCPRSAIETRGFRRAGYGEVQAGVAAMEIAQRVRHGVDWTAVQHQYAVTSTGCTLRR
jgi:hypothetical protein